MSIHNTAIVEDGAQVADSASVGPFCRIGPDAQIGDGAVLVSHVVVSGRTHIGARTIVHPFAVLGGPPQHLHYKNEPTSLRIGEDVIIREHATMNPGTPAGGGETHIGDRGFFMAGAHVGHDCQVGNDVIFANNATLGGHAKIGDHSFLGGLCAIHQNCRVGDYAFIGGCAAVVQDIIPYASAYGNHARIAGLNIIGMKRRNTPRATIHKIRAAFRTLFGEAGTFKDRLEQTRSEYGECVEVSKIIDFVDAGSARSLMPLKR
ncbi:MAG: acyl-ACP--UDP-N-acetylglucosamine O-acyltransferase [Pseudomonadota bacterium]